MLVLQNLILSGDTVGDSSLSALVGTSTVLYEITDEKNLPEY